MLIVRPYVPLRQPEDGQYRPKHVVIHYIVIIYTSCDTVVFDYIQFSKFHTHNGDDTLPRHSVCVVKLHVTVNYIKVLSFAQQLFNEKFISVASI